jgi:hypothetical protein
MAKTSCILHIFPDKLNWRLVIRAQGDATHPGATPAPRRGRFAVLDLRTKYRTGPNYREFS